MRAVSTPRAGAGRTLGGLILVAAAFVAACEGPAEPPEPPSSSGPSSSEPSPSGPSSVVAGLSVGDDTVTVVAAGDIARNPEDAAGTAALIGSIEPDAVLALGDNAYESGSATEFMENYDPTWGAFKEITRPIPGNHDYKTPNASGYFDYFRSQIHGQEYYAWDAGRWRMYALNCDIECGRDSEQLEWLREDLAAHDDRPALAYVHEPYYTCSTRHPPLRRLDDIWRALDDARTQLVLSGNNHAYERFEPLDAEGDPSPDGMRQFVVGTGGARLYPLATPCGHRQAQTDTTHGILKLELNPDSYTWQFIGVGGEVLDEGEADVER